MRSYSQEIRGLFAQALWTAREQNLAAVGIKALRYPLKPLFVQGALRALQHGRRKPRSLEDLFEFEFCPECDGDSEAHVVCVVPGIGNYVARCLRVRESPDHGDPATREPANEHRVRHGDLAGGQGATPGGWATTPPGVV